MPIRTLLWLALLLPLGPRGAARAPAREPPPPHGIAILRNPDGRNVGQATLDPAKDGVRIEVSVAGLEPGRHGMHLHAAGRCAPPDFASAGDHLNPTGRHHGRRNRRGAHVGDLPNLVVGRDGRARATFTARGATLGEGKDALLGYEGAALVIHAGPDDERTDPAGNSGARIACGVVERR